MADAFARRKFAWLDQVGFDLSVSALAFRLAFVIASKFWNRSTHDAWPSQETLARLLGIKVRCLRDLVDQLVIAGHLTTTVGHGRGHTTRYCPVVKASPATEAQDAPAGETAELFPEMQEPATTAPAGDTMAAEFETWWHQYPKKAAKQAAQRVYSSARKAGASAPDLLAGAMRYSAERTGQDPKYTKHPATWLNGGCWNDEHPATTSGDQVTARERPRTRSHLERGMGGLKWPS